MRLSTDQASAPANAEWLVGEGEMVRAIRAFDWASTPLGPLESWPSTLRVAVGICLGSRLPMFVWWGPELINLYNDAYAPVLGARHPAALGRPARATWHEIWDVVGAQAEVVMTRGEATWNERVRLMMQRHGYVEETYFTWSYSPIRDENGRVVGLFCGCTEDTARVAVERERDRLASQRQLALDASGMGWWHLDAASQRASFDARFGAIFGLAGSECPNAEVLARLVAEDRPRVVAAIEAALDPLEPRPYAVEFRLARGDGTVRLVEARGQATFEGDGPSRRASSLVGTVADVTERRRADELPRTILESITDAFFAVDRDWRFTYVNRQAERVLGRSPGDMLGQSIWEVYPGLEGSEFEAAYRRAVREQVAVSFTEFYPDHDRWYEVHAYPAYDGLSIYFRDVTARKAAESERDWLAAVVRNSPDFIGISTLEGVPVFVNAQAMRMVGMADFEEARRTPVPDYFVPEDRPFVRDVVLPAVLSAGRWIGELRLRHTRTGAAVPVLYDVFRIDDPKTGRPTHLATITRDITEQQRAAERDRFLVALDNATRVLSDPNEITQVAARMLGERLAARRCAYADVAPDELSFHVRGEYTAEVPSSLGQYDLAQFGARFAARMRAGEPHVVEDVGADPGLASVRAMYRRIGAGSVAAVPLHKAGRLVGLIAVYDALPRHWRSAEIELLRQVANRCWESIQRATVERSLRAALEAEQGARAEAEQANRMKDEFLATLSHELRTPLNAILGWSHMVARNPGRADTLARGLATIERNARAQAQIIDDLLDMSSIISGKVRLVLERVDLLVVAQAAVETVRPAADAKGVALRVAWDVAEAPVAGDPGRLQQVLWNLLSNAVKFTPRDGTVELRLVQTGDEYVLRVTDSGEGIDRGFLPYVFDRFRQQDGSTTRRHGGLGLGLSIVKQLVELHGGRVAAHSDGPGAGSTFRLTLPAVAALPVAESRSSMRPSEPVVAVTTPQAVAGAVAGLRVLVVDDEPDALALAQQILEDRGARVTTAASADEALAEIAAEPPDVLVSDIAMPGQDGYALIARVRARGPERGGAIPAVALTAYARAEDRARSLRAGYQSHLAKPVEPEQLVAIVASVAER